MVNHAIAQGYQEIASERVLMMLSIAEVMNIRNKATNLLQVI